MENDVKRFLEKDNINMSKFLANSEIIKNETREIYQAIAKRQDQTDISNDATETIHWMVRVYNQPLGYSKWFITAYPDVVKWFSDLDEEKITAIIGSPTEDFLDENNNFKLEILRKIVDAYKIINVLECSQFSQEPSFFKKVLNVLRINFN